MSVPPSSQLSHHAQVLEGEHPGPQQHVPIVRRGLLPSKLSPFQPVLQHLPRCLPPLVEPLALDLAPRQARGLDHGLQQHLVDVVKAATSRIVKRKVTVRGLRCWVGPVHEECSANLARGVPAAAGRLDRDVQQGLVEGLEGLGELLRDLGRSCLQGLLVARRDRHAGGVAPHRRAAALPDGVKQVGRGQLAVGEAAKVGHVLHRLQVFLDLHVPKRTGILDRAAPKLVVPSHLGTALDKTLHHLEVASCRERHECRPVAVGLGRDVVRLRPGRERRHRPKPVLALCCLAEVRVRRGGPAARAEEPVRLLGRCRKCHEEQHHLFLAALDREVQGGGLPWAGVHVEARQEQGAHAVDPALRRGLLEPLAERPLHAAVEHRLDQVPAHVEPALVQRSLGLVRHVVAPPARDVTHKAPRCRRAARCLRTHLGQHQLGHVKVPVLQGELTREDALVICSPRIRAVPQEEPRRAEGARLAGVVQRVPPVLVADPERAHLVGGRQRGHVLLGVANAGLEERLVDQALLHVDVVPLGLLCLEDLLHVQLDLSDDAVHVDEHADVAVAVLAPPEPVVHLQNEEVAPTLTKILAADPRQRVVELIDALVDDGGPHHVREAGRVVPVLCQHLGPCTRAALELRTDGLAMSQLCNPVDLAHELHGVLPDRAVEHVQAHDLEAHVLPRSAVAAASHELAHDLGRGREALLRDRLSSGSLECAVIRELHGVLHVAEVNRRHLARGHLWHRAGTPQAGADFAPDDVAHLQVELLGPRVLGHELVDPDLVAREVAAEAPAKVGDANGRAPVMSLDHVEPAAGLNQAPRVLCGLGP
mmetsp:Transcript_80257/g.227234  ORF Transcript_80257/g.227234 Transcript_80257/m.227234 type:complete len:820 (-) Transcript_80257:203-2662(-)